MIVIDQLGARKSRGPLVVTWSNDHKRGNLGLERTAQASLRAELGSAPASDGFLSQIPRMALPIGAGARRACWWPTGWTAASSGSGELTPDEPATELDEERFSALGRSALRLVAAVDGGREPEHGSRLP